VILDIEEMSAVCLRIMVHIGRGYPDSQ
jgi:hypothetical protein